ncbi:MAG: SH3 domain-containing protein [Thermosynechococcaceae cyanobacterium MS004]|nr:SH3 domain-containing protein [Thermosynechococcaceae cyanobacterium MS004]
MRIVQTALGILLGLLTLGVIVGGVSYLFLQNLSRSPAKPSFAAVNPEKKDKSQALQLSDDGSYPALVVYQGELVVRDSPASSGKVVDKLVLDETVVVEGTSEDGRWQQVRVPAKGVEGWVGNGNLKRAQ